jgi:hypothetical protein
VFPASIAGPTREDTDGRSALLRGEVLAAAEAAVREGSRCSLQHSAKRWSARDVPPRRLGTLLHSVPQSRIMCQSRLPCAQFCFSLAPHCRKCLAPPWNRTGIPMLPSPYPVPGVEHCDSLHVGEPHATRFTSPFCSAVLCRTGIGSAPHGQRDEVGCSSRSVGLRMCITAVDDFSVWF